MLLIILERASKIHNLGKRCTMFIRTSFADVWRIDSFCVLITYSRSSCWPKILNTFMTWHLLRVLSHKDTTPQDKQLYMYNVKFEKMTTMGVWNFDWKISFPFQWIQLNLYIEVKYFIILYLLIFFLFQIILLHYYTFFQSIILVFTATIYFSLPQKFMLFV